MPKVNEPIRFFLAYAVPQQLLIDASLSAGGTPDLLLGEFALADLRLQIQLDAILTEPMLTVQRDDIGDFELFQADFAVVKPIFEFPFYFFALLFVYPLGQFLVDPLDDPLDFLSAHDSFEVEWRYLQVALPT